MIIFDNASVECYFNGSAEMCNQQYAQCTSIKIHIDTWKIKEWVKNVMIWHYDLYNRQLKKCTFSSKYWLNCI